MEELQAVRGMFMRLECLRSLFCKVTDFNDPGQIECATKGYLLFLLGCTLFADKSTTRLLVM